MPPAVHSCLRRYLLLSTLLLAAAHAVAQVDSHNRTPLQWINAAEANETAVIQQDTPYLHYHMLNQTIRGVELRDEIESRDGMVARLIALNGKPLTPEADAAERARLQGLLDKPSQFYSHHRHDQQDKDMALDLLHQFPQAMLFTYAMDQTPAANFSGSQVVIEYKANPAYRPPAARYAALQGLSGRVWIDTATAHMVRMTGNVMSDTDIGWGILARIYHGGTLEVEQADAGPRWVFSHLEQHYRVRAMLVKMINVNEKLQSGGYQPIASVSFQDAIRQLLATPLPEQCPCY